jgi:hypothetical protein
MGLSRASVTATLILPRYITAHGFGGFGHKGPGIGPSNVGVVLLTASKKIMVRIVAFRFFIFSPYQ